MEGTQVYHLYQEIGKLYMNVKAQIELADSLNREIERLQVELGKVKANRHRPSSVENFGEADGGP